MAAREPEVEVGKVDRDEHVGPLAPRRAGPAADRSRRSRGRTRATSSKPGDRHAAEVPTSVAPRGAQAIAAEAGDRRARCGAQDLGGQRAGVQVAGRLAARDHHAHAEGDQPLELVKSAGSSGTLYSTLRSDALERDRAVDADQRGERRP